ncbi:5-oxoprolinase subunit B family protein [Roseobacteraceae bacterium S113]
MNGFPHIAPLGAEGLLVRFDDRVSDEGNAAALALCADVLEQGWRELREVAPALTSVAVFFDPLAVHPDEMRARLRAILDARDWSGVAAPAGRLWRIPVAFGGAAGPQLREVADLVGLSEAEAVASLCAAPLRVLALGFAPGQPYLGILPQAWDIPRQQALTSAVPEGAVVVAVRQAIIFATSAPTGWRQVGWTGFRPFRRGADDALRFAPGDRVCFEARPEDEVHALGDHAELVE